MALTQREKEIITQAASEGRSFTEALAQAADYRFDGIDTQEETPTSEKLEKGLFMQMSEDAPGDVVETGQAIGESFGRLQERVEEQMEGVREDTKNPLLAGARIAGRGLQFGAETIGNVGLGLIKTLLPQKTEDAISAEVQKVAETETGQAVLSKLQELEADENIGPALGVAEFITTGGGASAAKQIAKKPLRFAGSAANQSNAAMRKLISSVPDLKDLTTTSAQTVADNVHGFTTGLRDRVKVYAGKQGLGPQVEVSARRFAGGAADRIDIVTLYDEFLPQAQKAVGDTKVDPPLSVIGEELGNQFRQVVADRRTVGKAMAKELEKVAEIKTDVSSALAKFDGDLQEAGLRLTDEGLKKVQAQVKMSESDINLLNKYANELTKLGNSPSVGDLDAFLFRIRQDVSDFKSTNNLIGTTNGERVVLSSLADIRSTLLDEKALPAIKPYAEARATYSDLSDFIGEGERFLGKVTQSGDFARDASLLKSSVQSLLNNGKKDWLLRLEALTGYNALDRSVIALQAMKDAGDARGLSLLETVADGALPKTKSQLRDQVFDFLQGKITERFTGSPEEATRAYLKSIVDGE